jgi:2-keto-4-pentenoate hydratase/2-oxohepta-3-ene-1,7-dioic acid hydratase in catechol pathway
MKLLTYRWEGAERIGVLNDQATSVLDLQEAAALRGESASVFADMLALIDAGVEGLGLAGTLKHAWPQQAARPLDGLTVLAPIPVPRQIRDCLVFEEHLANSIMRAKERSGHALAIPPVWYRQPIYYKCNRFSVVGPDADVQWPAYSDWMDYECELACVIGRKGKDIRPDDALDHVFGFTIFNDFSARDAQYVEMEGRLGPAKGKDFDTGNVFGPWIVTRDEIGDPHSLAMEARVNGRRMGGGSSRDMHHSFNAILAHVSASETIFPGEIINSGTVGTGCGNEIGYRLQARDVVELEIEKIGVLRNRVVRTQVIAGSRP